MKLFISVMLLFVFLISTGLCVCLNCFEGKRLYDLIYLIILSIVSLGIALRIADPEAFKD